MEQRVAFVITAHGYGHASREMEVVRTLLSRRPELSVDVLTAVPEAVFRDYFRWGGSGWAAVPRQARERGPTSRPPIPPDPNVGRRVRVVPHRADVGLVQRDGLVMDHDASLRALAARFGDPDRAADALAAALAPHRPSAVVADIPAVAFAAARRLDVPSVGVGNFDWALVYDHYAATQPEFARWADLCRAWQALATVAVHLEPGPPLGGFGRVVSAPPIARRMLVDPRAVRERLAIPDGHRAVLASFGGFGLDDPHRRIPRIPGVTWVLAPPMPDLGRDDTRFASGAPYLGLLAAVDAVFTKPGYGIVCEAARHRTRMLYTDRGDFPEYPWLVRWIDEHLPAVHVPSAALDAHAEDTLREALERLFAMPDRWSDEWGGADRVAEVIEDALGR